MINTPETRYTLNLAVSPSGMAVYRDYIPRMKFATNTDETPDPQPITHDRFKNDGTMSDFSRRKMRRALEWLLVLARPQKHWSKSSKRWIKHRITFITLTLPANQQHSDQIIKSRCLNPLLIELRKFHGMRHYVWRAEKQANGNIHFHIVANCFIDASVLRQRWNRICNTLGYVGRYTALMQQEIKSFGDYYNRFINQGSYSQLMRRYLYGCATAWSNPNSTDIHSVRHVHNLVAYLFKYISKNIENPDALTEEQREQLTVKGQIWGLSESLSKLRSIIVHMSYNINEEVKNLWNNVKAYTYTDDFFQYKAIRLRQIKTNNCPELWQIVLNQIAQISGEDYLPALT